MILPAQTEVFIFHKGEYFDLKTYPSTVKVHVI